VDSEAWAIDNNGDVAGLYYDSNFVVHGFLYSGGVYTTIDSPGDADTYVFGMNDNGEIVGSASTNGMFRYEVATQTFTYLTCPGLSGTAPYGINDNGDIVGDPGFKLTAKGCEIIDFRGNQVDSIWGISMRGEIVGTNFTLIDGIFTELVIPVKDPTVRGISPDGSAIVGWANVYPNTRFGLKTVGFVYRGPKQPVTLVERPEADFTYALAINNAGMVAGYAAGYDVPVSVHAFVWTP
jgi:uncharacterized membrane protein